MTQKYRLSINFVIYTCVSFADGKNGVPVEISKADWWMMPFMVFGKKGQSHKHGLLGSPYRFIFIYLFHQFQSGCCMFFLKSQHLHRNETVYFTISYIMHWPSLVWSIIKIFQYRHGVYLSSYFSSQYFQKPVSWSFIWPFNIHLWPFQRKQFEVARS